MLLDKKISVVKYDRVNQFYKMLMKKSQEKNILNYITNDSIKKTEN